MPPTVRDLIDQIRPKSIIDPVALANVEHCLTQNSVKLLYLETLNSCSDEAQARTFHEAFRVGKVRQGPLIDDMDPDEGLGFLLREDTFIKYHCAEFSMDWATFSGLYRDWMSYYEAKRTGRAPSMAERSAANLFLRSPVPTRLNGEIWLFRHPAGLPDPFQGLIDDNLPKRLGLILEAGERRLTLGFFAKNVEAIHRPRFLDATWDYLHLWDWQGKTRPLPGTPASVAGLREVVAEPPVLRDLNRPIERIQIS